MLFRSSREPCATIVGPRHITKWFIDTISGTTDLEDRPAVGDMMTALHANGTPTLISNVTGQEGHQTQPGSSVHYVESGQTASLSCWLLAAA